MRMAHQQVGEHADLLKAEVKNINLDAIFRYKVTLTIETKIGRESQSSGGRLLKECSLIELDNGEAVAVLGTQDRNLNLFARSFGVNLVQRDEGLLITVRLPTKNVRKSFGTNSRHHPCRSFAQL